jgi:uncharacterized membrane protein YedE/YeeE
VDGAVDGVAIGRAVRAGFSGSRRRGRGRAIRGRPGGRDVRVTRARWAGNRGWVGAGARARDPRRRLVAGRRGIAAGARESRCWVGGRRDARLGIVAEWGQAGAVYR